LATLILFAAATASLSMCFDMSGKSTEYPFIQVRSMWSVAGRKRGQNTLECMVLPDRKPTQGQASLPFHFHKYCPSNAQQDIQPPRDNTAFLSPVLINPRKFVCGTYLSIKKRNRGHHGHPRTSNTRTKEELLN
jgi:hypothetical protein